MNFNVYIDAETGRRLDRLAKARRTSRNALIREAVAQLLDRKTDASWPKAVLDFKGLLDASSFEDARGRLRPPQLDPLA